jgi:glycosyltransferase involved in cell wall biosynthesis
VLVRTVHNEREWGKRPLRRLLLPNLLYPFIFDAEMGVAQRVVDNLDQRWVARGLGRKAIRMYNALNFERFANLQVDKAAKRASLGVPPSAPLIGTVGRLTLQKGYHILLEAVPMVLQHYPDAHFLIVGTGDLATALQEQAQRSGLEKQVHFTGARNDVEELFAIFDLFVSSSLWEGLPTVILESMAAGVPVVATRVSGSTELVNEGVTGLLADSDDSQSLAQAILSMLNDSNLAQSMAASARAYVHQHFGITAIARQHAELYDKLAL